MNSNVAIEYRTDITDYPSGKYYYNPSNKYPEYPSLPEHHYIPYYQSY